MPLTPQQQREKIARYTRTCPNCGAKFLAKVKVQKFCSSLCCARWNYAHGRQAVKCENCGRELTDPNARRMHMCNEQCWKEYLAKLRERIND
jgi:DNA-directed RNA polymerase subunit RPC12/RpoP